MEKYLEVQQPLWIGLKNIPNKSNINLVYLIKHNAASSSSMWKAIANR